MVSSLQSFIKRSLGQHPRIIYRGFQYSLSCKEYHGGSNFLTPATLPNPLTSPSRALVLCSTPEPLTLLPLSAHSVLHLQLHSPSGTPVPFCSPHCTEPPIKNSPELPQQAHNRAPSPLLCIPASPWNQAGKGRALCRGQKEGPRSRSSFMRPK